MVVVHHKICNGLIFSNGMPVGIEMGSNPVIQVGSLVVVVNILAAMCVSCSASERVPRSQLGMPHNAPVVK